jgi:hypothetical protein
MQVHKMVNHIDFNSKIRANDIDGRPASQEPLKPLVFALSAFLTAGIIIFISGSLSSNPVQHHCQGPFLPRSTFSIWFTVQENYSIIPLTEGGLTNDGNQFL